MSWHTPGPYRRGKPSDAIVADCPAECISHRADGLAYYGGHLIAESIRPHDLPLLMTAPDLLAALEAAPEPPKGPWLDLTQQRTYTVQWVESEYLPWFKVRAAALAKVGKP